MSATVRHQIMTIEDFLAWEARQETKFEFDGFEPVAMPGGTRNHARLQRNLAISIGSRRRGGPCEFLGSDMKVVTAERSRYPDGQVVCGPASGTGTYTTAPVALFEIISPTYEKVDRVDKAEEYRALPSVRRYVILEQDRAMATVMERGDGGWTSREAGPGEILHMPEIGISVPMSELYDGVR